MDRKTFKSQPQTVVKDSRSGEIKKIIHPADTEIGTAGTPRDLKVYGTISGSINLTAEGLPFIAGGVNVTVTSGSNGQILISAAGASGAPSTSQYVTIGNDASLTAERALAVGTGLRMTDGGAGGSVTLDVKNNVYASLTGSNTFSNDATFTAALTGSIQRTSGGVSYLVAGTNVTITSGSNGQITIAAAAASGAPSGAQYLTLATDATLSAERVLVPSTGLFFTDGGANGNFTFGVSDSAFAALTGSNFTGPVTFAVPGTFSTGLSGSLTKLANGTSFLVAGTNVTITTGSNGQVTIASTGGTSSGGGDPDAQYLVLATTGSLSGERLFLPSTGLKATDGGANGNYTISVDDGVVATLSGSTFTGAITAAAAGITGSITRTTVGTPFITTPAGNVVTVTTGSNGQIILSGSGGPNQGAPKTAQYLTLAVDGELTVERVFTPSTGLKATDGGAGAAYTLIVHDGTFASISGSTFTGAVTAPSNGGFTGSITKLVGGAPFITAPAGNMITVTTGSGGQIIISGSGDGTGGGSGGYPPDYASLTGSTFTGRVTAPSNGGFTGSLTQLVGGAPFITAVAGNVVTITTGSGGQIIFSGSSGANQGAPKGAQFLTLAADSELTVERVFTPGTGLKATDGGAGAAYTLNANDGVLATISGSTFTGPVVGASNGGFTGSLTRLAGGTPFVTVPAGNVITLSTGSLGQIILSGSGGGNEGAPKTAQYLTLAADGELTVERVFTPSTGLKATDGGAGAAYTLIVHDGAFASISGSTFTGAVTAPSNGGFTGSMTRLVGGTPFVTVPAGNVVTVSTGSGGQIIISGSGGGNEGAPKTAQYLTLATDSELTVERVFTPSTGLKVTDGGAGAAYTVTVHDGTFAALTGSNFTGLVSGSTFKANAFSGSLTTLSDGTSYLVGIGGVTITSQSNGQIFISASAGGSGGSGTVTAQYLVLATDPTLVAERVLVPSTGLFSTDAGANGNFTIGVNDRFFAALTGSVFSGVLSASGGISGSIQQVGPGISYLAGGLGVAVTSASNGQVSFAVKDGIVATISGSTFTGPVVGASNGGFTGSLTQLVGGAPFVTAVPGNVITITTGSGGQIIFSGSGGANQGAPKTAQFLTLAADSELTVERVFTPGVGLKGTDGGAGAAYTLNVDNGVVATISGSTFAGPVVGASNGGFTGSMTRLAGGTPFITAPAGNMISVSTGSLGQIIISGSGDGTGGSSGGGGDPGAQYLTLAATASLHNERVFTPGVGVKAVDAGAGGAYTLRVDDGLFASFSGSATFAGDLAAARFTGPVTGSHTTLDGTLPFITTPAGNIITVTTGSNGQIILSGSGDGTGGGSGAPSNAQYLVLATDGSLSAERVLTPGTGLKATDAGANGAYTMTVHDGTFAALTGSVFSGVVSCTSTAQTLGADVFFFVSGSVGLASGATRKVALFGGDVVVSGSISGSITKTAAGLSFVQGQRGILVASGGNGQITLTGNDSVLATISGSTFTGPVVGASNGGFTGSMTRLAGGTPFITAVAGNVVTLSTGSLGQIILSGSGGGNQGAPKGAQYLALATDSELTSERVFTPSTGLKATDAGANGAYTVVVHDGTFAALTGSTFTGAVSHDSGGVSALTKGTDVFVWISGSATKVGGPAVTAANRKVVVFGGDVYSSASLVMSGAASFDGQGRAASAVGKDIFFFVSGSTGVAVDGNYNRQVAVFGGDVLSSGSITAANNGGFTGSLTTTAAGTPYITAPAGNAITVTTGSNGQVILSASVSGGSGASTSATYLQLSTDATNTSERVFTPSTGLKATDGGAGGNYTVIVHDGTFAALTGSTFTGAVSHDAGGLSALSKGTDVFVWISGSVARDGGATVTSGNRKVAVFGGDAVSSGSWVQSGSFSSDPALRAASTIGKDVYFFVSGTFGPTSGYRRRVAVFGGDVVSSGSFQANFFSGSIQKTFAGLSYLVAGSNVTISSASNGQITITSTGGSSSPGGSNKQVQFNDSSTFGGNVNFTFDNVLGAVTASILNVPDHIDLAGGSGPVATTGSIRTGYTDNTLNPLWTVLDSNLIDMDIIRYGANILTIGSTGYTRLQGTVTSIHDSAGTLQAEYYPGLGYIGGVAHSFDNETFQQASAYGTDIWFYVSGSAFGPAAANNSSPDPVSVDRRVAVFGGDVHHSGNISFEDRYPDTRALIQYRNYDGIVYDMVQVTGVSSNMTWGNNSWYNTYAGYSVDLVGNTNGCRAYDGRSGATTDLTVITQYLTSSWTTTTATNSSLSFAVNANELWAIEFHGNVSRSSTSNGVSLGLVAPDDTTVLQGNVYGAGANSATIVSAFIASASNYLPAVGISATAGGTRWASLYALIQVGANAGNVSLRFGKAPHLASGGTITLVSGSYWTARRMDGV